MKVLQPCTCMLNLTRQVAFRWSAGSIATSIVCLILSGVLLHQDRQMRGCMKVCDTEQGKTYVGATGLQRELDTVICSLACEARATMSSGDLTLATSKRMLLCRPSTICCMATISPLPCNQWVIISPCSAECSVCSRMQDM